jgi:hypothetical protein
MRTMVYLMSMGALFAAVNPSFAADWVVARATTSGACAVQSADSRPILGIVLATKPTAKEACSTAKDLQSSDISDTSRCFEYTNGATSTCSGEGITLP